MKKVIYILIISLGLTGCTKENYTIIKKEKVSSTQKEIIYEYIEAKPIIEEPIMNEVNYSSHFKGINGCAVFYNPKENGYDIYNGNLCEEQISPHSTFKIISTLMGLSSGIVDSPQSTLADRGVTYGEEAWKEDVTLEEAFKKSYVWYYESLMNFLDKSYVQEILKKLEYGSGDISVWDENSHNTFWISSSLAISPLEQIEILEKIFEGKTDFTQKDTEILKELMLVEENDSYSVYGKTGSARRKDAWFVGFVEEQGEKMYFAVKLDDEIQELAGKVAKEIALDLISTYYVH